MSIVNNFNHHPLGILIIMVESGEDIEKKETETIVEQLMRTQLELTEKSIEEFKQSMRNCDLRNSLKSYMNIEHFLQRSKDTAYNLVHVDREKGMKAFADVEALQKKAWETSEALVKGCECKLPPFKYITELPKE